MSEQTRATISAAIVLVINLAALFGVSLDLGMVTNVLFGLITLGTTVYAAWKNHNFTPEAAEAQIFLNQLKDKQ